MFLKSSVMSLDIEKLEKEASSKIGGQVSKKDQQRANQANAHISNSQPATLNQKSNSKS